MHLNGWSLSGRSIAGVVCAWAFACAALAGQHAPVPADVAAQAVAQGATVVDVRSAEQFAAGHIRQAVSLQEPLSALPVADLARTLSEAGVDLSRTVVIVGNTGDERAQALWQTLQRYATGRVLWLVGGTTEWQMRGYALTAELMPRKPVPQHLVALQSSAGMPRMAGSSMRASSLSAPKVSIQMSYSSL